MTRFMTSGKIGSRKQDLLLSIALRRSSKGWTKAEIQTEQRKLRRWTTAQLELEWKDLRSIDQFAKKES
jgi:hypothetical protein